MPANLRAQSQTVEGSLSDQVYEQILTRIIEGEFPINHKLPAETALSGVFGVSRPVLRDALKQLREDGIIVSRQGSGSYVRRRPDRAVLKFAPVGSIADIQRTFEFRAVIESEAAGLAAQRWTDATLAAIHDASATLEASIDSGQLGAEEDGQFHIAVCQAADNHYFHSTVSFMTAQVLTSMNLARSLSLTRPAERLQLVQDEHRAILAAIEARDGPGACDAMRTHIDNARRRVFEGTDD